MFCATSYSQTTKYFRLVKQVKENYSTTNVTGGQYITFIGDICYESDKNGIGVGHGTLTLSENYSTSIYPLYIGGSYWGTSSSFKFNSDKSILNIVLDDGTIYVYKLDNPPYNQETCSLIRNNKHSNTTSNTYTTTSTGIIEYDNSYNDINKNNSKNISRNKTKVRKRCAYCSGKGERIQHEYVSTFGLDGPRVHCNICNQSWNYGTVHAHHKCNHCNGTGYYEYEY